MYIVMEIQKTSDAAGGVATLVSSFTDKNSAESSFHTILAAAAISSVPVHSAVMLTDTGIWLRTESYEHPVLEPEPEVEPETEGE